ncbi:MAG: hypothetical protein AAB582_01765 [Patescibacteria group bacterium]
MQTIAQVFNAYLENNEAVALTMAAAPVIVVLLLVSIKLFPPGKI